MHEVSETPADPQSANPAATATAKPKKERPPQVLPALPHSWSIESWPVSVFPSDVSRARYLVRMHRAELLAVGALCRIGRQIVVIGPNYAGWLARQSDRVRDFPLPCNGPTAPQAAA